MKRPFSTATALGLALAGCSGGEDKATSAASEEKASTLQPGEYEITAAVQSLRSTDKATPATVLKEGSAPAVARTCVGPDNAIEPAAFAEAGDTCKQGETYMRNGRMSIQLQCNRPGHGSLSSRIDGTFQKDSFSATVSTTTYFSGSGDYALTRSVTGKRVGDGTPKA